MTGDDKESSRITNLNQELGAIDRQIVDLIHKLTLVSGSQIRRLLFETSEFARSGDQRARRALLRLTQLGLLARLERRIGGKKCGSEGFCYRLAADGQRLVTWWREGHTSPARLRPEPGERFINHRLSVSELYVRFMEAGRCSTAGALELLDFQAEPDSWRSFDDGFGGQSRQLKPDAFLRLGVGQYEHWWFCELDLGTVSRRARESQADAYRAYWRSGEARELMPRVLWVTPNELVSDRARAALQPHREPRGLFVVASLAEAVQAATTPAHKVQV